MSYVADIRVRYGEVDQQGVVFNAHYLAYLDDALDTWLRELDDDFESLGWDLMLKKAVLEWHSSAGTGDLLTVIAKVSRWGNTSFDVSFEISSAVSLVLTATITYVGVKPGTAEPVPPPAKVRSYLSR
tara:strand:- start:89 stop:472 length:384 start_codon:yes stop_codon:yes gene_type:complete